MRAQAGVDLALRDAKKVDLPGRVDDVDGQSYSSESCARVNLCQDQGRLGDVACRHLRVSWIFSCDGDNR